VDVPVADFEADNTTPGIDETVSFTDLSTNSPDTWSWLFSPSIITYTGGTTSASQNPQVQFNAEGLYTVQLIATNISGSDTEIKTNYIDVSIPVYDLDITVFLEGPFNGSLMNSDLSSVLPLNQPYNVAPWNYNGSETVVSIPGSNIVDWVVVELRHALSAPQASSATILNQQAAFLRNDGQVVDLYGNPVLNFEEVVTNNLYVVIHHRIHLSIMSSTGLTETDGTFSYDFSTSVTKAYLSGQNLLGGGYSGMIGGNGVPQDNTVNSSDKSLWNSDAGTKGYLFSDYNLDGETNNPDKNDIWIPNEGKVSQVPD
jgi:PKD repeat protein